MCDKHYDPDTEYLGYHTGPHGSFEVFEITENEIVDCAPEYDSREGEGEGIQAGIYWAAGQPGGYLWDGDPVGPFANPLDAYQDAMGDTP